MSETSAIGRRKYILLLSRHDFSGLCTGATEMWGASVMPVDWTHGANQRLTEETKGASTSSWAYDSVSNRTSQTADGNTVTALFGTRDRLTTLGSSTFTWDVSGRLTTRTASGATTRFGWQDADRLTQVQTPSSTVSYDYDAQGLLVSRANNGNGSESYTWDGTLPYGQMVATTGGAGTLKSREVWGVERLAEIRNDTVRWLLTDGLGNVRAITDSTGKIIGREDFDAWGNRTLDSGRTSRFGYRGEWSDSATGLVYLRARWMDPTTGRFVSEDPEQGDIEGPLSLHRYLYANSGPVNFSDPTGRETYGSLAAGSAGESILDVMSVMWDRMALSLGSTLIRQVTAWGVVGLVSDMVVGDAGPVSQSVTGDLLSDIPDEWIPGAIEGSRFMAEQFRQFSSGPEFKRQGKHWAEIWGYSPPQNTPKVLVSETEVSGVSVQRFSGGKGGRVFQFKYGIGKNANFGQGLFLYRLDYMDYRGGPHVGLHYHLRFGSVNIDHEDG